MKLEEEIELIAYRLIRIEARKFDRDTSDSEFANYVRGIVDMQTNMHANLLLELKGGANDTTLRT